MIATIRFRENGQSRQLCQLDLIRFPIEQVRYRLEERGIKEEKCIVTSFEDWQVDVNMTIYEAYLLKRIVLDVYDGDELIVKHFLRRHKGIKAISAYYYIFLCTEEVDVVKHLLRDKDKEEVIELFFQCGSWLKVIMPYLEAGKILNTEKGFYIRVEKGEK